MNNKIIDINKNKEHFVSELICVICGYRYIGAWTSSCLLKDLECNKCHNVGGIIKTGQDFDEDNG